MHARGGRFSDADKAAYAQAEADRARRAHHLAVASAVSQSAPAARDGVMPPAQMTAVDAAAQRKAAFLGNGAMSAADRVVPISGAIATVRIVERDGQQLIAKMYDPTASPSTKQHLDNELALAGRLRHPNIIAPRRAVRLDDGRVELEMEYASGGSLGDYVKRAKYAAGGHRGLAEREAAALLFGLVDAVHYLHGNGVVHGDVKLGNAMIDRAVVRLIDFGTASVIQQAGTSPPPPRLCGTLAYTPPEGLEAFFAPDGASGLAPADGRPGDIWALGVVLVNLLTLGDFPFAGRDEESLRAAISAGAPRLPAGLSESCAELLGSMLARDPRQRATAASVHRHPWLTSVPRVDAADPMVATDISAHLAHLLPPNGAPAGGQLFKGGGARGR